jgi:hypothetical protein
MNETLWKPLYPPSFMFGAVTSCLTRMFILKRFAEHGGHLPIFQRCTHCFTEELGSQMTLETIRASMPPWWQPSTWDVREAAEAFQAKRVKCGELQLVKQRAGVSQ